MLTEIVSPETMPKNNRKMPKGQRFIIGALGIGNWEEAGEAGAGGNSSPLHPSPSSSQG
jgi:hypothetical protein